MLRRLGWIIASYLTRPLILIFVAVGVVMTGFGLFSGLTKSPTVYEPNYPQVLRPSLLVDSQATLEAVRREGHQAEVDGIDLNRLWAEKFKSLIPAEPTEPREIRDFRPPGEAFFRVLEEFPNLRIVTMSFYGKTTGTRQLARLPRLEYLTIDGTPPEDFSWLDSLEKLRWLELTFFMPLSDVPALTRIPNVETVVFRSRYEVTDDVLKAMAEVPRLKQLVLFFYDTAPQAPPPALTEAGFAALDRSKSLKTLYVGSYSQRDNQEFMALASAALPHLDVQPARRARARPLILLIFPCFFFAMAIGTGLSTQFRGPICRLAPGFSSSHALVASLLFAATGLLGALLLIARGYDPLASMIVAVALVAATVCMASTDNTPPPVAVRRQQIGNLFRILMLFGVMGPLVLPELGLAILVGSRPLILILIGLVALGAVGLTIVDLRRRMNSAIGDGYLNREGPRRRILMQSQNATGWMFTVAGSEQSIENWAKSHPAWTWWRRVRRWQVGNAPFRHVPFVLIVVGVYAAFTFIFRSMLGGGLTWPPRDLDNVRGQFLTFGIILSFIIAGRVTMAWRARMLTLPVEMLRPYARRAMQNEMAAAFLLDLARPMLVVAAVGAIGMNIDHQFNVDWWRIPFDMGIVALAALATTAGLGSVGVVVKRDWLVTAIFLAIGVLLATAVGAVTALQFTSNMRRDGLPPHVVELQLVVLFVVGSVLAEVMRRRFLSMELGNRA